MVQLIRLTIHSLYPLFYSMIVIFTNVRLIKWLSRWDLHSHSHSHLPRMRWQNFYLLLYKERDCSFAPSYNMYCITLSAKIHELLSKSCLGFSGISGSSHGPGYKRRDLRLWETAMHLSALIWGLDLLASQSTHYPISAKSVTCNQKILIFLRSHAAIILKNFSYWLSYDFNF